MHNLKRSLLCWSQERKTRDLYKTFKRSHKDCQISFIFKDCKPSTIFMTFSFISRKSKILKTSLKNYLKIVTFHRSLNFFKALSKSTKNFQPGKIRSEKSFLERFLERTITMHVWCFALIIPIFISDTKRIYSNIMKIEIYEVRNILHLLH